MADDFDRAKDLFEWNARVFAVIGVWPLKSTYVKFTLWIVYFLVHMSTLYADLFYVFGNLELVVQNLSDSMWEVMIISKLFVMRFSKTLAKLTQQVIDSVDRKNFENEKEMEIYLNYNRIAKTFFKLWFIVGISASCAFNFKPLTYRLKAALQNESVPFILSYRARFFFEVNDSTTFWLIWIYQTPVMCFSISQCVTIGYLFALILHVCGQLSVLTSKIHNLNLNSCANDASSRMIFHDIVNRHRDSLSLVRDINKVFGLLLLEELLITTLLIGLSSYSVLTNVGFEDLAEFLTFSLYASGLLCMIYGYCLAGEYLVTESMNLYEAYYKCQWYDTSGSFKKQLIICMIGARIPTQLTAGGFYNFTLEGFTSILKSAAGYISMLRTMI